ncbi:MAG: pyridoxal phosphate-dependent aminotransferase [Oscillospiraceae bacterium]|nr:pyridoxal phosphate-dependent aminotransferase [Oscillospiraceae bacterium]
MIRKAYIDLLQEKDVIFEQLEVARALARRFGEEQVFNFCIGSPSVPSPRAMTDALIDALETQPPRVLHSYSPSLGLPQARAAVAESLNTRYGSHYAAENIFMTVAAAGAIAHALRAVTEPGDEVLTFAPCFGEYQAYTAGAGLTLRVAPPTDTLQIDFDACEHLFTPKTAAVLINSPNNPSGVVCSTAVIDRLAALLRRKSREFGHTIYLISDEPYREIVFHGVDAPFIANHYPHTLVCYSYSKALSIPGERIGYLAVNPECDGAETILEICPQISRTLGQNGAPSLFQFILPRVSMETADLAVYERNRDILYRALREYGYACVEPGGTFYLFPRAPEPDAKAFCARAAQEHRLVLVPGDSFYCPGYFRVAYCVPTERVERALPIFRTLAQEYGLCGA